MRRAPPSASAVAAIGQPLSITAKVGIERFRPRLIQTSAESCGTGPGTLVAEATGKYVPLSPERNREFVNTLLDHPSTQTAGDQLETGRPFAVDGPNTGGAPTPFSAVSRSDAADTGEEKTPTNGQE